MALRPRLGRSAVALATAEGIAGLDRLVTELLAQLVHCGFGCRATRCLFIDEIGWIGTRCVAEIGNADADQSEFRAVCLAFKQPQADAEDPVCELRRVLEPSIAGPALEVRGLSFSTTVWPAIPLFFSRRETFSERRRRIGTSSSCLEMSSKNVVSAETLLAGSLR